MCFHHFFHDESEGREMLAQARFNPFDEQLLTVVTDRNPLTTNADLTTIPFELRMKLILWLKAVPERMSLSQSSHGQIARIAIVTLLELEKDDLTTAPVIHYNQVSSIVNAIDPVVFYRHTYQYWDTVKQSRCVELMKIDLDRAMTDRGFVYGVIESNEYTPRMGQPQTQYVVRVGEMMYVHDRKCSSYRPQVGHRVYFSTNHDTFVVAQKILRVRFVPARPG